MDDISKFLIYFFSYFWEFFSAHCSMLAPCSWLFFCGPIYFLLVKENLLFKQVTETRDMSHCSEKKAFVTCTSLVVIVARLVRAVTVVRVAIVVRTVRVVAGVIWVR